MRREAVMTLGWIGDKNSIPVLKQAILDDDWTVRQSVAAGVGKFDSGFFQV